MKEMTFFDANAQIGFPFNCRTLVSAPDAQTLINELDRSGVAKTLVRHAAAPQSGAGATNTFISDILACDKNDRLCGVWSFLPEATHELPENETFFQAMRKNKIRAITLYPAAHRFVPVRISIGRIMDAARERKIPILISSGHFGSWNELYRFVAEFPANRYICMPDSLWGTDRYFRPLLETYADLHIECGAYWVPEGVADLVKTYGAERILYGSGYPEYDHGSMMLAIRHSTIDQEAKALLAGGNLEKMISEVEL